MYTLEQTLNRIIEVLTVEKTILPLSEICYIKEGVSKETISQLVSMGYIICEGKRINDGSIPIVIFLYNKHEQIDKVEKSINQFIHCKYPGFKLSDIKPKKIEF